MLSRWPTRLKLVTDVAGRLSAHLAAFHSKESVYGRRLKEKNCAIYTHDEDTIRRRHENANLYRYIEAYREHGHKKATIDPLRLHEIPAVQELDRCRYGLDNNQNSNCVSRVIGKRNAIETHDLSGLLYTPETSATVDELTEILEREYCGTITAEFRHLPDEEEREWFAEKFEGKSGIEVTDERRVDVAKLMLRAEAFDKFLGVKFSTLKRYSGEGNETMLAFLDELFRQSITHGVTNIVACMAHRGRLNLLTCLLNYPPVALFNKIANPVAAGKVRSIQQTLKTGPYNVTDDTNSVLCVQIHGDAAVTGQGVVAETMAFAQCPHFTVNGTIHLITNNQIGFTTDVSEGRSSRYSSDFAKLNGCPVIHVNADDPESVLRAACIGAQYRREFQRDIVIDMVCYRRWGHNELDEPAFTQPTMYSVVRSRSSIPSVYADNLTGSGVCTQADLDQSVSEWRSQLDEQFALTPSYTPQEDLDKSVTEWRSQLDEQFTLVPSYTPQSTSFQQQWSGLSQAPPHVSMWDTGVSTDLLKFIGAQSVHVPSHHKVHPTLQKAHIDKRLQRITDGANLDWATGEALAIGSLLLQGHNTRISGQDVSRGTFSHRHAAFFDQDTNHPYIPLNNLVPDQTHFFELCNSILSEEAVMAFEYGFSIDNPRNLVIWEAQFGDFFTGAQIVVDTFLSGGETKWLLQSGLVLLLPHGYDGAGPEHTSCKIDRFLQQTDSSETKVDGDNVNFSVVNPTTPAQYFHLLRRQMVRNFRKPLVVVAPKVLLKHPTAVSDLSNMAPGTSFQPVLPDTGSPSPENVKKLVFCSGKHYYRMDEERVARGRGDIGLVRLESLCPFPAQEIRTEIEKYINAQEFIWCQEEHRNTGAWSFVYPRFHNLLGVQLRYIGRSELAAPAVGIAKVHNAEAQQIIDELFT